VIRDRLVVVLVSLYSRCGEVTTFAVLIQFVICVSALS